MEKIPKHSRNDRLKKGISARIMQSFYFQLFIFSKDEGGIKRSAVEKSSFSTARILKQCSFPFFIEGNIPIFSTIWAFGEKIGIKPI